MNIDAALDNIQRKWQAIAAADGSFPSGSVSSEEGPPETKSERESKASSRPNKQGLEQPVGLSAVLSVGDLTEKLGDEVSQLSRVKETSSFTTQLPIQRSDVVQPIYISSGSLLVVHRIVCVRQIIC